MRRLLLSTLTVVLLSVCASAQEGATARAAEPSMTLTGAVYDVNGAVIISGTSVVARGSGGKLYETVTNSEGFYTFRLPLGVYDVEAASPGFCPTRSERFRVVDATHGKMALDFVLTVEAEHRPCARRPTDGKRPEGGAKKGFIKIVE